MHLQDRVTKLSKSVLLCPGQIESIWCRIFIQWNFFYHGKEVCVHSQKDPPHSWSSRRSRNSVVFLYWRRNETPPQCRSFLFTDTRNERKITKLHAKHNPLRTKSGDLLLCSSARMCLGCHQCHL